MGATHGELFLLYGGFKIDKVLLGILGSREFSAITVFNPEY